MDILDNYIQALFQDLPFSKEIELAKDRLKEAYHLKYQELIAEGKPEHKAIGTIMYRFGDLKKAGRLIGMDLVKYLSDAQINKTFSIKKAKQAMSKVRIASLLISLGILTGMLWTVNWFMDYSILFAILLGCITPFSLILGVFIWHSLRNLAYGKSSLEPDAAKYLRFQQSLYQYRFLYCFMLFLVSVVFWIQLAFPSQRSEFYFFPVSRLLENIWILGAGLALLLLSSLILHKCNRIFAPEGHKPFTKFKWLFILLSLIYWIFAGIVIFRRAAAETLRIFDHKACFVFLVLYVLIFTLFNFISGKQYTTIRLRVKKGRVALSAILGGVMVLIEIMNSGSWWIQPYISFTPAIAHRKLKIRYNKKTGRYSIYNEPDTDFKILQLTDIHIGGSLITSTKDLNALTAVFELIRHTVPDLVIITGDLVYPLGIQSFSFNNYTPIMQFASFMRNIGIPWAFTYGNHDTEFVSTHSAKEINQLFSTFSYGNTMNLLYNHNQPDIYGRNNQIIEVVNADGSVNQLLFLLDSNDYASGQINDYDSIHDDQVQWYADQIQSTSQKEGRTVSSLVFFHIPLQEFKTAYQLYKEGSPEVEYYFGAINETNEGISCSRHESKLFETAVRLGSTKGMFMGHDHLNDLSLSYRGIRLTYGKSIDYMAYPGISKKTEQRGGTLITVKPDSSVEIEQIRLSDIVRVPLLK